MATGQDTTDEYPLNRVQFATHRGKRVLLIDYRGCTQEEIFQVLEDRLAAVHSQPAGSVLTLVDASGVQSWSHELVQRIKETTAKERPYVKRAAVVGDIPKEVIHAVTAFSVREFKVFKSRQDAMDWLVSEAEEAPPG